MSNSSSQRFDHRLLRLLMKHYMQPLFRNFNYAVVTNTIFLTTWVKDQTQQEIRPSAKTVENCWEFSALPVSENEFSHIHTEIAHQDLPLYNKDIASNSFFTWTQGRPFFIPLRSLMSGFHSPGYGARASQALPFNSKGIPYNRGGKSL